MFCFSAEESSSSWSFLFTDCDLGRLRTGGYQTEDQMPVCPCTALAGLTAIIPLRLQGEPLRDSFFEAMRTVGPLSDYPRQPRSCLYAAQ